MIKLILSQVLLFTLTVKMMSFKFNCFLLYLVLASNVVTGQTLGEEPLVRQHFDSKEIHNLEAITSFFEGQLRQNCDQGRSLDTCYARYIARFKDNLTKDEPEKFKQQKQALFDSLGKAFFSKIWLYNPGRMRTPEGEMVAVKSLNYNTHGSFVELLKSMEKQQDRFVLTAYMDILLTSGGVSPSAITGMIDYYDRFDIPIRVKGNLEKQE